ncbi:MAG: diguanylate cyclase domain protein [Firmicutes bacterium]|nr:diguanylate cyclase domain protein [Bacillota bacterium]
MTNKNYAIKISLLYFAFGVLWIFFSDTLATAFFASDDLTRVSMLKGWLYVGITSFLIYLISNRYIGKLAKANKHLQNNFDELTAMHEELIATEEELRQQYDELSRIQSHNLALLQAIPDLMLRMNEQGVFLDYKPSPYFPLFTDPKNFLGKTIFEIFPEEFAQSTLQYIQQTLISGDIQLFEYQLLQDNHIRHFESRFAKSGNDEILAIIRDITDRKRMEQELKYLGHHDTLTGTYNRTYFEAETLKIAGQTGKTIGIFSCDVDGLKLINDTLGHPAGDELLKVVARVLTSCATSSDIVARTGGDEFAILIVEPNQTKMLKLSSQIKETVELYNLNNPQLPLSLSIGWAMGSTDKNIDAITKEADNNMYREKMHQSFSSRSAIVQAMMQALEARDYITEGHANRLQTLTEAVAKKLQLLDPEIADLRLLAKFHDIGKVGIPDQILFKPDRLTQDELIIMRRHCEIGFRIAKSAPDLAPIAEFILKHQEWWNGDGYPLGIAGEEIPLSCRIIAIADAFDAMTNSRPYRKAMEIPEAIAELRRCAGTQFDPKLTEIFIATLTSDQSLASIAFSPQ